jgi:hypothetical protein
MRSSSSRLKALTVTFGISFWVFIFTTSFQIFSLEYFIIFIIITLSITQIFAIKLSKTLDKFSIINSKIFLGLMFVFVISLYGILFKILRIDLLRLKNNKKSYWLEMESLKSQRMFKQY